MIYSLMMISLNNKGVNVYLKGASDFYGHFNATWRVNVWKKDVASLMLFADLLSLLAFSPGSRCLGSTAHRRTPISLKRVRQEPSANGRIRTNNLNDISARGS